MSEKVFTVMVIGDNPESLMEKYNAQLKVEPFIKYHYKDAEKLKQSAINVLESLIRGAEGITLTEFQLDYLKDSLQQTKEMSTFDYYSQLTQNLELDEEGNAWCNLNPDRKWDSYRLGNNLSVPFILNDGKEVYQARKGDINWHLLHMNNVELYRTVWALIKEGKQPSNEQEEQIVVNMKNQTEYFSNFPTVDDYVAYNCSYWTYAVLSASGWVDVDSSGDSSEEWIKEYYDYFINPLDDDTLITIYEYTINIDEDKK